MTEVTTDEVVRLIRDLPAKSSTSDYLPVSLLKSAADMMASLTAQLANLSFSEGVFLSPLECRTGQVGHVEFQTSDESEYLIQADGKACSSMTASSYHVNTDFSDFQSAYRPGHSTETALTKVINDVITAMCEQRVTLLLSLDVSAAFDTIDLSIVLGRLASGFGSTVCALNWLWFFVTDHTQYAGVRTACSTIADCTSGVCQSSFVGPLLFALCVLPINNVITTQSVSYVALQPNKNMTFKPITESTDD